MFGVPPTISGKVIDGTREQIISGASVIIFDTDGIGKDSLTANVDGVFSSTYLSPGYYSIRIIAVGYQDTLFQNTYMTHDTVNVFDIHRFCKYDSSLKNKTCPICKKQDKVIPIAYGLLVSMKGEGKTFKAGGCNITYCDPNWYCKRDKLEF